MPKKRTNYKHFQGPSATKSGSHQASKDGNPPSTQSVNELLSSLRVGDPLQAAVKKRELAELVNQRSVPPYLRSILGVPDVAPPRARAAVRARERLRTPGPAPPRSWVGGWRPVLSLMAQKKGRKARRVEERARPRELMRFESLVGARVRDVEGIGARSLTHYALKTIAENWELLDEEDYPALAEMPQRLRLRLLSYISRYGPTIDLIAFKALTQGTEIVYVLDLAGLIGHSTLSLQRLTKLFKPEQINSDNATAEIVDSWDEDQSSEVSMFTSPSLSRFSQLTHLCLSHPPSTILWKDMLSFTRQTPQLTHLSLAYWPRPTLTPNLATTTVSSQHSPDVQAGGSHFYSSLDQDLVEPASLLRQLSHNLLRLLWLDLEGCTSWTPALAVLASPTPGTGSDEEWSHSQAVATNVFTDSWKKLDRILLSQGWLPTYAGIQALPTQQGVSSDRRLVKDLLEKLPFSVTETHDQLDAERRKALMWLEAEIRMLSAAHRINKVRRENNSVPITMDVGWTQTIR